VDWRVDMYYGSERCGRGCLVLLTCILGGWMLSVGGDVAEFDISELWSIFKVYFWVLGLGGWDIWGGRWLGGLVCGVGGAVWFGRDLSWLVCWCGRGGL